jgi:phospholipase C
MLEGIEIARAQRRVERQRVHHAGTRPRPEQDEGSDGLPEIEHIIVLMMENHSYDNYFGMLAAHGDGMTVGRDGLPTAENARGNGSMVRMARFKGTVQKPGVPTQSWNASHIQWNNGACDGFVRSIEETLPGKDAAVAMTYWTEADLPFYYGLARTFPLATRWFCSCLGPTFPNRRFLTAATAHGLIDDQMFGMVDYPEAGTIFDLLSAHSISWANYHSVKPWQINLKRVLGAHGVNVLRIIGALLSNLIPSLKQTVQSKLQATADMYPLGLLSSINHLRTMKQFYADARRGGLPSVVIVDPDFGKTSEENPQNIQNGEAFAATVINAVMQGPAWSKSLLIWLYDEHGGYYDHVAPPAAVPPDDVPAADLLMRFGLLRFILKLTPWAKELEAVDDGPPTYDRLGFRVPAVVVSPYARPGHVSETVYDHTSILKLIERKWNLPSLTRRDAVAVDPLDMIDLASEPSFSSPPSLPTPGRTSR